MKIAVLVPHHGPVKALFAESLANMMAQTAQTMVRDHLSLVRPETRAFFEEDGPLELKRTRLIVKSRKWGADYSLFVDSDQTFPPDALIRLLRRSEAVVGCNIVTRGERPRPTAIGLDGRKLLTTEAKAAAGLLELVLSLGLGFCLFRADAFAALDHRSTGRRLFESEVTDAGELVTGEDVHFFNEVRASGLKVYLDHAVSWDIGHIAEAIRTNRDGADADLS
jgi:hypothetical protein